LQTLQVNVETFNPLPSSREFGLVSGMNDISLASREFCQNLKICSIFIDCTAEASVNGIIVLHIRLCLTVLTDDINNSGFPEFVQDENNFHL